MAKEKLIRELLIYPGFDKRNPEPSKNYGIHGCEVVFYIHSPRRSKTVQFKAYTDWLPLNVQEEEHNKSGSYNPTATHVGVQPMGADLGYHSPKPMYKGQTRMDCDLSKRGYCYYDGSSLNADRVRDVMLKEGSEGVWRELEEYYNEIFKEK